MVEKYYPLDFNQQEMIGLERQLNHFIIDASTNEDMKNISTLVDLCRGFVKTGRHRIFNLVDRLIRLLVTLLVSTATAEHIFCLEDRQDKVAQQDRRSIPCQQFACSGRR